MRRVALAIRQLSALYVNFQHFTSSVTKVTLRSNSDRKMASRLSLTEVLEAVLDDDSDDFGLSEDESSEGDDEGISAYAGQHYMNPEEVASLGRVVAQESVIVLIRFT